MAQIVVSDADTAGYGQFAATRKIVDKPTRRWTVALRLRAPHLYNVDLGIVYDATKERLDGFSEGDGCHLPLVEKKENLIPFIINGG